MFLKPRRRRQGSHLQANTAPGILREDRRRAELKRMPPDSVPPSGDQDDLILSDYEREMDRLDASVRARLR